MLLYVCLKAQTDSVYTGQSPTKKKETEKKKKDYSDFKKKLFYGGNLNVFFINRTSVINLNPTIGYKVTEKFQVGGGLIFTYYSSHYSNQTINAAFYGPHTFARFFITDYIYLQAQYDKLHQPIINYNRGTIDQGWVDYFLIGGGARRQLGPKTYVVSSILYNVNYNPNQPSAYFNPMIQFGIVTGF